MWRKINQYVCTFDGNIINTATMKNSMDVPQITKNRTTT